MGEEERPGDHGRATGNRALFHRARCEAQSRHPEESWKETGKAQGTQAPHPHGTSGKVSLFSDQLHKVRTQET